MYLCTLKRIIKNTDLFLFFWYEKNHLHSQMHKNRTNQDSRLQFWDKITQAKTNKKTHSVQQTFKMKGLNH